MSKHNGTADDGAEASTNGTSSDSQNPEDAAASPADINDKDDAAAKDGKDNSDGKRKISSADWPLKNIKEPHENDVMYGRGGGTNHHPGNKRYRKLVEERKVDYVMSKRLDKPLVALDIIRQWRAQDPPGRFLKLDDSTGLWNDVGDKKAREKTSQALREKAPSIRKQQEEERNAKIVEVPLNGQNGSASRSPSRPDGNNKMEVDQGGQVKRPLLARDHTFGREFFGEGEKLSLDRFSWQEPFQSSRSISFSSMGSLPGISAAARSGAQTSSGGGGGAPVHPTAPPPPPPHAVYTAPAGRTSSHGSMGMHPTYHTSVGGPPSHMHPPPPPDYYGRVASNSNEDRRRRFSSGRFESWGSIGSLSSLQPFPSTGSIGNRSGSFSGPPPPGQHGAGGPPPPPGAFNHIQRSGSWTQPPVPPLPSRGSTHQRSGSWSNGREHSLLMNPLSHASTALAASPFDANGGRTGSGYWAANPPPPPPPGAYGTSMPPPQAVMPPPNGYPSPSMSQQQQQPPPMQQPMGPYREPSNNLSPYGGRSPANSNGTNSPRTDSNIIPPARSHHNRGGDNAAASAPSTPNYNVDLSIAKTWSGGGGDVRRSWSGEDPGAPTDWSKEQYERPLNDTAGGRSARNGTSRSPMRAGTRRQQQQQQRHRQQQPPASMGFGNDLGGTVPKPGMVKRDTSHQNESRETKPSIKRATLSRDQSETSNRLKQQYLPEFYDGVNNNGGARFDKEIRMLSDNLEETKLKDRGNFADSDGKRVKPKPLGSADRLSTVDKMTLAFLDKPEPLLEDNRTSTIDALDLNLEDDNGSILPASDMMPLPPDVVQGLNTDAASPSTSAMDRPLAIKEESRLTTMDFLEMVNEPLEEERAAALLDDDSIKPLPLTNESVTTKWLAKV